MQYKRDDGNNTVKNMQRLVGTVFDEQQAGTTGPRRQGFFAPSLKEYQEAALRNLPESLRDTTAICGD